MCPASPLLGLPPPSTVHVTATPPTSFRNSPALAGALKGAGVASPPTPKDPLLPSVIAPFWTSVLLGVALGAANATASLLLVRAARGRSQQAFLTLLFGGMVARMARLLEIIAAVLVWAPVQESAFIGALAITVAAGVALEVFLLTRPVRAAGA